MVEFTHDIESELIALVEERPCLWNSKDIHYHNRHVKEMAMREITEQLGHGFTESMVKSKWANLRSQFQREVRKIKESAQGGHPLDRYMPKWAHYQQLQFLRQDDTPESPSGYSCPPEQQHDNSMALLAIILPWLSTSSAGLAHASAPIPSTSLVSVADQHMPSTDAPWILFDDRPAPSTTTSIATSSFIKERLDVAFSGHESSGLHATLSHYFFTMQDHSLSEAHQPCEPAPTIPLKRKCYSDNGGAGTSSVGSFPMGRYRRESPPEEPTGSTAVVVSPTVGACRAFGLMMENCVSDIPEGPNRDLAMLVAYQALVRFKLTLNGHGSDVVDITLAELFRT